jgi:hypothetical protein
MKQRANSFKTESFGGGHPGRDYLPPTVVPCGSRPPKPSWIRNIALCERRPPESQRMPQNISRHCLGIVKIVKTFIAAKFFLWVHGSRQIFFLRFWGGQLE